MRSSLLAATSAVGVLALFTACAETASEPVVEAAGQAQRLSTTLAASNAGGSDIDRFTTIQFILIYDAETQLLSAHMPSNVCADGSLNIVAVKRVRTPSPVNSVSSTIKDDDSQAAIYRIASPSEASLSGDLSFFGFQDVVNQSDFCAFLAGPNLVAEGTVRSISTFSAASYSLRRQGSVRGVDGRDYHLTEVYQLNADAHDPNNPATFNEIVSSVSLKPVK